MRLVLVELTRARWRRAVLLLLAGLVVVPVVIGVFSAVSQSSPGGDDQAEAERLAAENVQICLDDPDAYFGPGLPAEEVDQACRESNRPEFYLPYDKLDIVAERLEGSGLAAAVIVGLIAMLVGTTFVGHDWNTGSMSNQLLFETRRLRVWAAKGIAVGLLSGVMAAVGTTLLWLVLAGRYALADADVPDGALLDGLQQGWRAAALAAGAALGGYALTMLSRSTVFTLGVLFGVSVAGGILIGLLVEDRGWVDPTLNAYAVIQDGTSYTVERDGNCSYDLEASNPCLEQKERSLTDGVLYLGGLLVVGGAASAASFGRRDVP